MPKQPAYKHQLRYDVSTLEASETTLERWPDLAVHSALVEYGFGDNDPFLRYAVLLGEGSGLHRAIVDYAERKREALRLSGVGSDHARYKAAFDLTDTGVQVLRWTWLKLFSSRKFRAYIATCAAYDQNCMKVEAMIAPESPTDEELDEHSTRGRGRTKPSGELKADAEQRAYKLRNDLIKELAGQDTLLGAMEAQLFYGDEELKQIALEKADTRTSWEDEIMRKK